MEFVILSELLCAENPDYSSHAISTNNISSESLSQYLECMQGFFPPAPLNAEKSTGKNCGAECFETIQKQWGAESLFWKILTVYQ